MKKYLLLYEKLGGIAKAKLLIILLVIIVVIGGIEYVVFIVHDNNKLFLEKQSTQIFETKIRELTKNLNLIKQSHYSSGYSLGINIDYEKIYNQLIIKPKSGELIDSTVKVAEDAGLSLQVIKPLPVEQHDHLQKYAIEIQAQANYFQFNNFQKLLANLPYFCKIDELDIERSKGNAALSIELQLGIYSCI